MRFNIVGLCMALLLVAMAVPAHAQVSIQGIDWKTYPLEPGSEVPMALGTQTGSATLADGHIVFKFEVRDVDPIADDASDVVIQCVLIQNLGTATGGTAGDDIVQVMLLDQDSNGLALAAPSTTGTAPTGSCASLGQTNNPGNAQIRFEHFFPLSFTIPDDGSEVFQIAVRVNDTTNLSDNSQNHTVMLQVMLAVQETVGSPPRPTTFTAPTIMDTMPDVVWNGGINKFTEDTWIVNPIMPGDEGVVGRFTVCDYDANAHELILDNFFIRQGERGTANSSDLTALNLYRVEGFTRTLVASRTPDDSFNRSGQGEGLRFPGAGSTAIVIPDDKCVTFELEAKVSQFATKMHTIQPRVKISAREPRAFLISPDVDPEIAIKVGTMIGKGGILLPDTKLIGKPGIVPLEVHGVQLPGMGTLQVGPWGKLQYDPRVINIKSIRGVKPYVVDATEIDNRRGEARFTVRIDPTFDANGDGKPDDTRLTGAQDGTVAQIFVEPTGKPGDGTRLVLTFDCFELVGPPGSLSRTRPTRTPTTTSSSRPAP